MPQPPITRPSLLVRLRDPRDADAWRQFVDLYAPLVYGFARQRGLQDADAADLMQEVFTSVAAAADRLRYDPKRGTFRSWLYTITRNKVFSFLEGRQRRERVGGDGQAEDVLDGQAAPDDGTEAAWQREYERRAFHWAAARVRDEFQERTWQAFWRTAVDGADPKAVATELGLSPGAIYVAKSRVIARLRQAIRDREEEETK